MRPPLPQAQCLKERGDGGEGKEHSRMATHRVRVQQHPSVTGSPALLTPLPVFGDPAPSVSDPTSCDPAILTPGPSSNNDWRHNKQMEEGTKMRNRKVYTCRVCSRPMNSEGHTQFRGQIPGHVWLAKEEAARKKQEQ